MTRSDFARLHISIGIVLAITNIPFLATSAIAQEYRGTSEQQMACTPDVWRLCSGQVPDVGRIVTCLKQNTSRLSSACRAVVEPSGSTELQLGTRPLRQPMKRTRSEPVPFVHDPVGFQEDEN